MRVHRSVFAKVVAIMIVMALCLTLLVGMFFTLIVSPQLNRSFDRLFAEYAHNVATSALTVQEARRVARFLNVDVRYEGPKGAWSTRPDMATVAAARRRPPSTLGGILPHRFYRLEPAPDGGMYLFVWSLGGHTLEAHAALLAMLLIVMVAVIFVAQVVLSRLLEPLRAMNECVAQIGDGHLEVQVPHGDDDEFGRLATAFNHMVARVRDMLRARDQLLVDVSHELRSPLTRMKVALALAPNEAQLARLAEDVDEMERRISDLLELERLRAGRGVTTTRQDLGAIVRDVAAHYADRPPGVQCVAPGAGVIAEVDATQVRTVLRNLLENAIKYSLPDSRPVKVSIVGQSSTAIVRVTDDGVGIPQAEVARVFEPFYRVDPSRSTQTGGLGLGLSICKRVMEAHGGTISAEPCMPRGTLFTLTFPA